MTTTDFPGAAVGLRSERGPVLLALMLCVALVALDATIIATAVPSIVGDLGGFTQFPWLFSSYLLAQAVSVPIYGKLSDVIGRKPIMFVGLGAFLVGSVLCGAAWSMPALIGARVVQGLGAGAVQPMAMTIVGDLYTVEERSRVGGYLASVWGMAAIVGPAIGGVFSEFVSWRWIFFVNLPIGAVAAVMLLRGFHESVTKRKHVIDYAGAALLSVGCSLLILGLLDGGVAWAWSSVPGVGTLAVGAVLLVGFVLAEHRATEPVLPLWAFTQRLLAGGSLVALGVGALLIGLSSYVPTYVQGVLGHGPLVAGFALAAMSIGWPLAASVGGRIYMRIGFRDTSLIGLAFLVAGSAPLVFLGTASHVWQIALCCFVIGIGLGLVSSPTLVAMQASVGWAHRGVVTGANMFSRAIGSAVGVAVFGAVANATLADNPPGPTTLDRATHHVFIGVVVVAVLMIVPVLLMPREGSDELSQRSDELSQRSDGRGVRPRGPRG